jgi:hypothetical protein
VTRRPLGTNRSQLGTDPAQTRAPERAIVSPEGGGKVHPTLLVGGGRGESALVDVAGRSLAR